MSCEEDDSRRCGREVRVGVECSEQKHRKSKTNDWIFAGFYVRRRCFIAQCRWRRVYVHGRSFFRGMVVVGLQFGL